MKKLFYLLTLYSCFSICSNISFATAVPYAADISEEELNAAVKTLVQDPWYREYMDNTEAVHNARVLKERYTTPTRVAVVVSTIFGAAGGFLSYIQDETANNITGGTCAGVALISGGLAVLFVRRIGDEEAARRALEIFLNTKKDIMLDSPLDKNRFSAISGARFKASFTAVLAEEAAVRRRH